MKKIYLILTAALLFTAKTNIAQITNASFETWNNMGMYSNPTGWDCFNDMTASMSVYTCEKGMPGSSGNYFLKLTSKMLPGFGTIPGQAVSGTFDMMSMQPAGGIPFSERPNSVNGKCKHSDSQGYMDVTLTRWDMMMQMRVTVATGHYVFSGNKSAWSDFSVSLNYMDTQSPDTCIILLSSSGNNPAENDYLSIDNLETITNTTGINNIDSKNVKIYPNPASNYITADLSSLQGDAVNYVITDELGKVVKTGVAIKTADTTIIDIEGIARGNYIVQFLMRDKKLSNQITIK